MQWTAPDPAKADFTLALETDPFLPIFCRSRTGNRWFLNDLWRQVQEATNPYGGIVKGEAPAIRTACFPYPGNVTVDTPDGPKVIGDVMLSLALWLDVEMVNFDEAKKVQYSSDDKTAIQRVEFSSRDPAAKDWREYFAGIDSLRVLGDGLAPARAASNKATAHHRRGGQPGRGVHRHRVPVVCGTHGSGTPPGCGSSRPSRPPVGRPTQPPGCWLAAGATRSSWPWPWPARRNSPATRTTHGSSRARRPKRPGSACHFRCTSPG